MHCFMGAIRCQIFSPFLSVNMEYNNSTGTKSLDCFCPREQYVLFSRILKEILNK